MSTREFKQAVQSVDRAVDILLAFNTEHPTMTLGEIAESVSLPLSSTHRIARSMVQRSFLRQEDDGRYALGPRLLELGGLVSHTSALSRLCRGVLNQLVEQFDETALLAEVDWIDASLVIIQKRETERVLSATSPVGRRSGISSGSIGVAVLSSLTEVEFDDLAPRLHLARRATESITDVPALRRAVRRARRKGWAAQRNEYIEGVSGVSVPVSIGSRPLGAVALVMPSTRASAGKLDEMGHHMAAIVAHAVEEHRLKEPS